MAFYDKYKIFKKYLKQKKWFYNFCLYRRKIAFFIPYNVSLFYLKRVLGIRIIKFLPIVNGVTALKYAIGEFGGDDLIKGEKVFIKICVRKSHRSLSKELVIRFNKIAGYKDENINRILFLKQGILLNFIVSSFIEDLVELREFIRMKKFMAKGIREKVLKELKKMEEDLKEAKIVHNDIHDGNIIVVGNGKDLYLALTDFSWVKEYSGMKDWKKAFDVADGVEFEKIRGNIIKNKY